MANTEVLKYFKEDEIAKVETQLWEDISFKEKYEAIKNDPEYKLTQLEETVEKTATNFEKRFEAFKKAVLEAEKKQNNQSIVDRVTQTANEVTSEAKDKATKKLNDNFKKHLEKTWGFTWMIWVAIFEWVEWIKQENEEKKWMERFFWSMMLKLWTAILGMFGINKMFDKFKKDNKEEKEEEVNTEAREEEEVEDSWEDSTRPIQENESQEESIEEEKKQDYGYILWFKLLLSLSGEKLKNNVSITAIRDNLRNKSYEEFINKKNNSDFRDSILWNDKENDDIKTQYEKVIVWLASEKTRTLLRVWLTKSRINKILMWVDWETENENLKESFWSDRFEKILKIKDSEFDYKKLTIKELSELYIYTLPSLTNWSLHKWLESFWTVITWYIWESDEIKDKLKDTKTNIFSDNFVEKVIKNGWDLNTLKETKEELINILWLVEEKDKKDLEKLFKFKEYILWNDFLNSKLLWLEGDEIDLLNKKLNYKNLMALYWIMWWEKIENLNIVNLPLVVLALNKIISYWNEASDSMVWSGLVYRFSKDLLFKNNSELSEDQYKVIEIYKDKVIDMLILSHLKNFYWSLWLATDKEWMQKLAAWSAILWWTWIYLWNKWIKSAIWKWKLPFLSKYLKGAWWLSVALWAVLGWLSMMDTKDDFEKTDRDLEKAYNDKNIDEIIKVLEKQKEWLKTYQKNSEELKLISYEWATPYLLIWKTIYKFAIFDKSDSVEESWILDVVWWSLKWVVWMSNELSIDWKKIDKITFNNWYLVLWDNVKRINFEGTFDNWEESIVSDNLAWKIDSIYKEIDEDSKFTWGTPKKSKVIKISDIDNEFMLWLVPQWELGVKEFE